MLSMLNVHLLLGFSAVPAVVVIPCQEPKNRLEIIHYRLLFDFSDSTSIYKRKLEKLLLSCILKTHSFSTIYVYLNVI